MGNGCTSCRSCAARRGSGRASFDRWHVKDFADKHVAHLDYTPVDDMPTFDELNSAIDAFGALFSKYYRTLTGSSKGVSATIIDDWMAPFQVAWLPQPSS
jgi:hypothetical protein